ncbi:MAG: leucine-rich repeat protein, partial [Acutalibacteraceae bacterium]|nr:leucine-rich repeat protein [Acutalibacteraceae bacterium]
CYPVGKQDTEYIVPDGVTSIGECAFLKSPGLTSVTLPESVTDIDGGAFYLCDQLESVTVLNENCSIHDDTSLPEETTMPAISYCRIRGYAGSTAESYVNNTSGIEFETIPKAE